MNRPPEILVNSGFEVDQNGALTETVTPNVVATLNAPTKVTFFGEAINWIPSTAAALRELSAPNALSLGASFTSYTGMQTISLGSIVSITTGGDNRGTFRNCTGLTSVSMPNLETLVLTGGNNSGHFYGCTSLVNVNLPKLTVIRTTNTGGSFYNCSALTSITLPQLTSIIPNDNNGYFAVFGNCNSLLTVNFPVIQNIPAGGIVARGLFYNCVGLTNVTLGSVGHPVSSVGAYTFGDCTQTGLTITIYTQGGVALSGEPWGATNATIEYEEA